MSDQELSVYIPLHGDRIRVKRFLEQRQKKQKQNSKRENLLAVLRKKIEDPRQKRKFNDLSEEEEEQQLEDMRPRQIGNKNAEKQTRKIELGWMHGGVQVRLKKGGGTRKVSIKKNATKDDLIKEGIRLFFPNGESPKGPITDFVTDLRDFSGRSVRNEMTVKEIYDETKLSLLRFYFTTKEKNELKNAEKDENNEMDANEISQDDNKSDDEDELPDLHVTLRHRRTASPEHDVLKQAIQLAGIDEEIDDNVLDETPPPKTLTERKITVHRGHVLKEMIQEFKDVDPFKDLCTLDVILPNGMSETAEDGGGVTRDILCEFWNSFFEECTLGSAFKVPCLRHDFGESEWHSVGKIIVFGWKSVGHFPIQLSIAFLEQCLYNTVKSNILDEFLKFIPESDAQCLKSALEDIESVDMDEFLEILDQHEIKRVPKQDTILKILEEIAHKELIQSSMFVIDCISPYLKKLGIPEDKLKSMYESLFPTTRKVLALLKFPETMSQEEIIVSNHVRRFVRELDIFTLKKFMRFCTGSDLLLKDKIEVSFVNVQGLARRPVAHTCSCLLEIPKTYENFPGFRTEFLAVLNANVWVMDII